MPTFNATIFICLTLGGAPFTAGLWFGDGGCLPEQSCEDPSILGGNRFWMSRDDGAGRCEERCLSLPELRQRFGMWRCGDCGPSFAPSRFPSSIPSPQVSMNPSSYPSPSSSNTPSTSTPSQAPSFVPSESTIPSHVPSSLRSSFPSSDPTMVTSSFPSTEEPIDSQHPSLVPTQSLEPTRVLSTMPSAAPSLIPEVLASDVTLLPPNRDGPIVASITAYNWRSDQTWPDEQYELPIYKTDILDREKDEFWTYLLDELLLARLDLVLLHGRGCHDAEPGGTRSLRGTGNMCPRLLTGFVEAVERAGVQDVIRVGMWDDTGMYRTARNTILGTNDTRFDVGNETNWQFFWDYNIKIWFDTIPPYMWFLMDGKPVIANWNLRNDKFINQQGNASRLLTWLKQQFYDRYGVEPYFIIHETWFSLDTSVSEIHADGKHGWFNPLRETYTYRTFNGKDWGVVIPGYRNARTTPGCGVGCREVLRDGAATLEDGLSAGENATLIMVEGLTNMVESAGMYRSSDWQFPTQQLSKAREYSDPEPETLLFQAEGADTFMDTTPENIGGQYSDRALDVGALDDNTGWYVGWTEPGEWLEYKEVLLGCGLYRFSARVATTAPAQMRLALGAIPNVTLDDTGGSFVLVQLGEIRLEATGPFDLRIEFLTEGIDLDWFFLKRIDSACARALSGVL